MPAAGQDRGVCVGEGSDVGREVIMIAKHRGS